MRRRGIRWLPLQCLWNAPYSTARVLHSIPNRRCEKEFRRLAGEGVAARCAEYARASAAAKGAVPVRVHLKLGPNVPSAQRSRQNKPFIGTLCPATRLAALAACTINMTSMPSQGIHEASPVSFPAPSGGGGSCSYGFAARHAVVAFCCVLRVVCCMGYDAPSSTLAHAEAFFPRIEQVRFAISTDVRGASSI